MDLSFGSSTEERFSGFLDTSPNKRLIQITTTLCDWGHCVYDTVEGIMFRYGAPADEDDDDNDDDDDL